MRNPEVMLFLLLLAAWSGCRNTGAPEEENRTKSGFPIVFHEKRVGESPQPGDKVRFFLSVYHNNGRIALEDMTGILPEWVEGQPARPDAELLQLMVPMDSASVYITGEHLARLNMQGLQEGDTVRYDIRFVGVVRKKEELETLMRKEQEALAHLREVYTAHKNNTPLEGLEWKPSGLGMRILRPGTGQLPENERNILTHYIGMLEDGTVFDNSYQRGEPFEFVLGVGTVIPGWEEAVRLLREGGSASLVIPGPIGYGKDGIQGTIPPDATIYFFVEVIGMKEKLSLNVE